MNHPWVLSVLTTYFNHLGIAFWCMTGERYGTTMKYSVSAAFGSIAVAAPLNVQAYSFRRFSNLLHRMPLIAQVRQSYPYTYYDNHSNVIGIDYFIFTLLDYAGIKLQFVHLWENRVTVEMMVQRAVYNLMHRTVDFTLTRWSIGNTFYLSIVLPETIDICLVVPRKLHPNHLGILLRPFSNTLWIAIGCAIGLGQIVLYLAKTSTKLGRWIRQAFWRPPLNSFFHITTEVLVFILIESYLAQVTSYLLVHRFHRDPITLEEFFATDIPIRYTDQQRTVFYALDANLSDRFLERAVPETTCEEFSEGCAHLDTVERATFFINNRVPFDLISGQKSSFILPEMLKSIRAQYLFARGATPFRDYFDLHLHWLRAFGFMDYTRRPYDYSLEAHWKRHRLVNQCSCLFG
ncbi:uncharacterized protein LOC118465250 isoform X2 [Anopheles albimanus]|uniref:uncharacterized protein LOC118465250 isoform X2 n=1 Tax=Anopheles albimanus TaxID=7167 RepID=UPI0016410AAF|nr:uncharacterized protein LOC118465250 isoform X2 [Anopheles albimanus]